MISTAHLREGDGVSGMKILRRMDNPIFYTVSAIVIQLTFLVCFLYFLSSYSPVFGTIYTILNILVLLVLISKGDNPSYKIIWIVVILGVPVIGGAIYLLFGYRRASKRLGLRLDEEHERYLPLMPPNSDVADEIRKTDARAAGTVYYLQNQCTYPVWTQTKSNYYPVGEAMYRDMLADLSKAEKFIFMEYFIIEPGVMWDGIKDILVQKAKEGLEVRVMYDSLGCIATLPKDYDDTLREEGIKCIRMNPVMPFLNLAMNNRDHRKIMVIDGNVAFSGGINLADEYINVKVKHGHWKDTGVRIKGAAVWNFTVMFMELWNAFSDDDKEIEKYRTATEHTSSAQSDGYVLPFADSPVDDEPISQNIYIDILSQAKDYVYIFTPYLIIDSEMSSAIQMAAKRGVDVRLITPGIPDKKLIFRITRANYGPLVKAGVKIFEYTPGFSHAKSFVSDDSLAVIGTINLDFRSLYLHFECGVLLHQTESVGQIKDDFVHTLAECRSITTADLKQNLFWQLFDSIIRVFSPLM